MALMSSRSEAPVWVCGQEWYGHGAAASRRVVGGNRQGELQVGCTRWKTRKFTREQQTNTSPRTALGPLLHGRLVAGLCDRVNGDIVTRVLTALVEEDGVNRGRQRAATAAPIEGCAAAVTGSGTDSRQHQTSKSSVETIASPLARDVTRGGDVRKGCSGHARAEAIWAWLELAWLTAFMAAEARGCTNAGQGKASTGFLSVVDGSQIAARLTVVDRVLAGRGDGGLLLGLDNLREPRREFQGPAPQKFPAVPARRRGLDWQRKYCTCCWTWFSCC